MGIDDDWYAVLVQEEDAAYFKKCDITNYTDGNYFLKVTCFYDKGERKKQNFLDQRKSNPMKYYFSSQIGMAPLAKETMTTQHNTTSVFALHMR